jgi:hypothetical protein
MHELAPWLAPTYFLDESDPDILVLRRMDGSFVSAFSARGATKEGIRQAAQEDFRKRHRPEPQPQQQTRPPSPALQEAARSRRSKGGKSSSRESAGRWLLGKAASLEGIWGMCCQGSRQST